MKKANLLPKIVLILAGCFLSGSALHAYTTKLHNRTDKKIEVTVHYALCAEGKYIINAGESEEVNHGLCCIKHLIVFFRHERGSATVTYTPKQQTGFGLTCKGIELSFQPRGDISSENYVFIEDIEIKEE